MKKKILFIIPSLRAGGAERTLINLLCKTDQNIYEISLLIVLRKGVLIDQIPNNIKTIFLFRNEILVRFLAFLQKKTGFIYFFKWRILKKIKEYYDVGVSFLDSNYTDLLFLIPDIGKRYAFVHSAFRTNKNFFKYYKNNWYRQKLINKRYKRLNGIYFVSQDAMNEFIEIFGNYPNMKVIYNIIDTDRITNLANAYKPFTHSSFTFVAIGSLLPVKGFDRLIRAAYIVKNKGYNFNIFILGSGPEHNKLKKWIKKLNLVKEIQLLGFVKNPYPFIKYADVFIMSSVSEALPTVLCEAMLLGKPVLVTNCSGCRELVDNGKFGIMAEQDDQDLAYKMLQYLTNKNLIKIFSKKSIQRSLLFNDKMTLKEYYKIFNS